MKHGNYITKYRFNIFPPNVILECYIIQEIVHVQIAELFVIVIFFSLKEFI